MVTRSESRAALTQALLCHLVPQRATSNPAARANSSSPTGTSAQSWGRVLCAYRFRLPPLPSGNAAAPHHEAWGARVPVPFPTPIPPGHPRGLPDWVLRAPRVRSCRQGELYPLPTCEHLLSSRPWEQRTRVWSRLCSLTSLSSHRKPRFGQMSIFHGYPCQDLHPDITLSYSPHFHTAAGKKLIKWSFVSSRIRFFPKPNCSLFWIKLVIQESGIKIPPEAVTSSLPCPPPPRDGFCVHGKMTGKKNAKENNKKYIILV